MAAVLALLFNGMAVGAMLIAMIVLPYVAPRFLSPATAGPIVREIQPACQWGAAAMATVAGILAIGQFAGVLLVLIGVTLLLQVFWLGPAIERYGRRGLAGEWSAMATEIHLQRANLAIGLFQIMSGVIAFALILRGLG